MEVAATYPVGMDSASHFSVGLVMSIDIMSNWITSGEQNIKEFQDENEEATTKHQKVDNSLKIKEQHTRELRYEPKKLSS